MCLLGYFSRPQNWLWLVKSTPPSWQLFAWWHAPGIASFTTRNSRDYILHRLGSATAPRVFVCSLTASHDKSLKPVQSLVLHLSSR